MSIKLKRILLILITLIVGTLIALNINPAITCVLAVASAIGVVMLIYERKIIPAYKTKCERYEEELSAYIAIYKSLPDLVFCKDVNGRYTNCNALFEEFIGYNVNPA